MLWGLPCTNGFFPAIGTLLADFGGPQVLKDVGVLASGSLNVLFYLAGIIMGASGFVCFSLLSYKFCILNASCLNMVHNLHFSLNN